MQKYLIGRVILFLALATFFLCFALNMEASWGRAMLFIFAAIDYVWGGCLLVSAIKNRKK